MGCPCLCYPVSLLHAGVPLAMLPSIPAPYRAPLVVCQCYLVFLPHVPLAVLLCVPAPCRDAPGHVSQYPSPVRDAPTGVSVLPGIPVPCGLPLARLNVIPAMCGVPLTMLPSTPAPYRAPLVVCQCYLVFLPHVPLAVLLCVPFP